MFKYNTELEELEFSIISYGKSKISFKDMKNLFQNSTKLNSVKIILEIIEHKIVDL